jgi:hypothetical protein
MGIGDKLFCLKKKHCFFFLGRFWRRKYDKNQGSCWTNVGLKQIRLSEFNLKALIIRVENIEAEPITSRMPWIFGEKMLLLIN